MLALLLASTLASGPIDLIPKRRTELTLELEAFDERRPSFAPGAIAMGFGVAASLVALMMESSRHDTTIYPGQLLYPNECVCISRSPNGPVSTVELGFAISAAVLTLAGSLWELYVGIDRLRGAAERDALVSAIDTALP